MNLTTTSYRYTPLTCLTGTLILITLIYQLGLPGDFFFDDRPNLKILDTHGEINNLEKLRLYLSYSSAGPTGRPLSMLSFLVEADSWPDNPAAFKTTNILLHNANSIVLFWLAFLLFQKSCLLKNIKYGVWIAFLASLMWAAHPLHVSTVLYVIQRMAILSTLFTLLGMIGYVYGRIKHETSPNIGFAIMAMSISLGTLLATLSKENGVLLPLLILIIENLLFSNNPRSEQFRAFKFVFLSMPTAAIVMYLIWTGLTQSASVTEFRGFTAYERLLTESGVLIEYLKQLILPQPYTEGPYQYHPIASSPFDSAKTFISLILILFLLATAWILRKKQPTISIAITFFFAAHLIESTTVPLEIYYEHRNYLPSIFLFIPLSLFSIKLISRYTRTGIFFVILVSTMLIVFTAVRCQSWANATELQVHWARSNPLSSRAQLAAAESLINENKLASAEKILNGALRTVKDDTAIRLHLLRITNEPDQVKSRKILDIAANISNTQYSNETFAATVFLSNSIDKNPSKSNIVAMLKLWDSMEKTPRFSSVSQNLSKIHHYQGLLLLTLGKNKDALNAFMKSLQSTPSVNQGIVQAALLADHKMYCESIEHLESTQRIVALDSKAKYNKAYYHNETTRLIEMIRRDAQHAGKICNQ